MNSDKTPLVSVIMAAYNAESTIEKSVQSILNQTYADFELLICDDQSKDRTYQLLRRLAAADSRIKIARNKKNMGQAYTRNQLFRYAAGELFVIVDADDQITPNKLKEQVEFLLSNHEYGYVAAWGKTLGEDGVIHPKKGLMSGRVEKEDFLWGMPFIHAGTMFRKELIEAVGGYQVNKNTRFRNEDYDLFMRIHAKGYHGYVIPSHSYIYYEGRAALLRRKFRYRLSEARIRYVNFRRLGMMPKGLPFVIKPLIVGLIPAGLLKRLRADRL